MSEQEARAALAEARSPAADRASYQARRQARGWAFGWRPEAGPPTIGTIPWVVADNGAVSGCQITEALDDVIARLLDSAP